MNPLLSIPQYYALDCVQNHLSEGSYLAWNRSCIEIRQISSLERFWRSCLSWTGVCATTAQRCAVLCKKTFETISVMTPSQPLKKFDAKIEENATLKAICYKVWQSALINWMEENKSTPLLPELRMLLVESTKKISQHNHSLNETDTNDCFRRLQVDQGFRVEFFPVQKTRADLQTYSGVASFLGSPYMKVEEQELIELVRLLKNLPADHHLELKEVEVSKSLFVWPDENFDCLDKTGIRLILRDVNELVINCLREKDDEKLADLIHANPTIDRLTLPDSGKAQMLPIKVAEVIKKSPGFKWIDMGSFMWPFTYEQLPISLIKLPRNDSVAVRPVICKTKSHLEWEELINPGIYLGPRIYFKVRGQSEFVLSLPLGFVRRLSGFVHHQALQSQATLEKRPFECEDFIEADTLKWLFKINHEGLAITSQSPQPDVELLLLVAQKWHMRSMIQEILGSHPLYWCHPTIFEQLLPGHDFEKSCPDFELTIRYRVSDILSFKNPHISVDRYALALSFPQRLEQLAIFSNQVQGIAECSDERITFMHLSLYYTAAPIMINQNNFEGFWVLALYFTDQALLKEVGTYFSKFVWPSIEKCSWEDLSAKNQQYGVERWWYLAVYTGSLLNEGRILANAISGRYGDYLAIEN